MDRRQARRWKTVVFLCVVVVAALAPARVIGQSRTVRVGIFENPPLAFMEADAPAGLFVDLLNEIAVAENWDLEYMPCVRVACLASLEAGDIDLVPALSYSAERDVRYDFSRTPVVEAWSGVYVRAGMAIDQLADVDGKRVAVPAGSNLEVNFRQMTEGLGYAVTLSPTDTLDEALVMAANGAADAALGYSFHSDRADSYGLKPSSIVFGVVTIHYVTAHDHATDLLEVIDRHLAVWIETPRSPYYEAYLRWLAVAEPSAGLTPEVLWIGGVVVGLLVFTAVATLMLRSQVRSRTAYLEAANARLRESEERFRRLVESTDDVVFTLDAEQRYTAVYGRWLERLGASPEDYLGKTPADRFGEAAAGVHTEANRRALHGESVVYESRVYGNAGSRDYQIALSPLSNDAGVITGVVGIGRDITALKQARDALRVSEARFRTLFEQNLAVLLIADPETRALVDANPAAVDYYGWSRDELLNKNLDDISTLSLEARLQVVAQVMQEGRAHYQLQHRRADGSIRDIEAFTSRLEIEGKDYLYAIVHDVTEKHQAEQQVAAWHALMQYIIRHDPSAIAVFDRDLRYTFVSDRYLQDYHLTVQDVIGKHHYEVFPEIPEPVRAVHRRVLAGEILRNDEDRFVRLDGAVDWTRWECRPWYLADGEVGGIVLYTEVITERKRTEAALQALNAELERRVTERTAELKASNEELEAFAYSVSHDLRAPLRAMDGFGAVLLSRYADQLDLQGQHYLNRIQKAAQRMGALINDLLELSRVTRQEMVRAQVDLSALGGEIIGELKGQDPKRDVEVSIAGGMVVQGDVHLLRIALRNLLDNAWKFTAPRNGARIELGVTARDGERIYFVRDNGVGFDNAYAGKLFMPFQRLHAQEDFPGTGIGLATVRRIVVRHGGRVWAEAAEGEGALFSFTLGGAA